MIGAFGPQESASGPRWATGFPRSHTVAARRIMVQERARTGHSSVLRRTVARHGRRRSALLLRRGAIMQGSVARSDRQNCDGLRFRATLSEPARMMVKTGHRRTRPSIFPESPQAIVRKCSLDRDILSIVTHLSRRIDRRRHLIVSIVPNISFDRIEFV